ncbi:MAG TPA: M48 family metalloprotease [Casimicrobiaceae bacterium]|nr:M48 family metalloprotease [Casimicrobiaceae bacterium]
MPEARYNCPTSSGEARERLRNGSVDDLPLRFHALFTGFESEGDDYGFAMLKRHRQSPQAFADLMRRLRLQQHAKEDSGSLLHYLSTHPVTAERIQRAEQQR